MIVVAKLTLALLWFAAFLMTCLVMTVAFPVIVALEIFQNVPKTATL